MITNNHNGGGRKERCKDEEDRLSIEIVNCLKTAGYFAEKDPTQGGHVDFLVAPERNRNMKWYGEAKIWHGVAYLQKGINQLLSRYASGREKSLGLLIYFRDPGIVNKMSEWLSHINCQPDVDAAKSFPISEFSFCSTHHHSSGVMFKQRNASGGWNLGWWSFAGNKEDYREVPEEVPEHPHAAERALWKAQREAGTNEVWQALENDGTWCDLIFEPSWFPKWTYRPKPKPAKLTAKIVRSSLYVVENPLVWSRDWEFHGTPEEYRAECEKYGYLVVSDITEVKTVKMYMAMLRHESCKLIDSKVFESVEAVNKYAEHHLCTIIGNIEEREVSVS